MRCVSGGTITLPSLHRSVCNCTSVCEHSECDSMHMCTAPVSLALRSNTSCRWTYHYEDLFRMCQSKCLLLTECIWHPLQVGIGQRASYRAHKWAQLIQRRCRTWYILISFFTSLVLQLRALRRRFWLRVFTIIQEWTYMTSCPSSWCHSFNLTFKYSKCYCHMNK